MTEPSEREFLHKLTSITKDKTACAQSVDNVATLLLHPSVRVRAKALCLLGKMDLRYPSKAATIAPNIAAFLIDENALLRERTLNALGRISRGDSGLTKPYLPQERINY